MCGLSGFVRSGGLLSDDVSVLDTMTDRLAHRGPDDRGTWTDPPAGVAIGHRRLSIIDLSAAAHQPMISANGRYVLAYNGEIYNHGAVRAELDQAQATRWRGHSDTETLLEGICRWGLLETLERCVGMFALALWDRQERVLHLARDRMGEKPLYYGWQGALFLFGSELKALRAHPEFAPAIDRDALAAYLTCGYVAAPLSIYSGIFKLPPGMLLSVPASQAQASPGSPKPYWALRDRALEQRIRPFTGSDAEAVEQLRELLVRSVRQQSVADVPLGAFLSGGTDSSTVVALMQAHASQPVRTFTIGFHESAYQEAQHARAIADHLGTRHTELLVSPQEAMQAIPRLPGIYDEPFGDSSAIPTLLVSLLARRQVTVALSGDGGDELFAGYARYGRTLSMWRRLQRMPFPMRYTLARGIDALYRQSPTAGGRRAQRLAAYLRSRTAEDCYRVQLSQRDHPGELVVGWQGPKRGCGVDVPLALAAADPQDLMMYADQTSYLPDDILAKVDRASMAASLEVRVPLLDHRVVEFAWSLPMHLKVRNGAGKWILRQVLRKYVPESLFERPKQGFGIPVAEWIRGPLRDWAEDLMSQGRLHHGLLNPARVRAEWARHLRGDDAGGDAIWQVLMFQAWLHGTAAA
jgi:asparagine synthase (glutamine-hydrolysing)